MIEEKNQAHDPDVRVNADGYAGAIPRVSIGMPVYNGEVYLRQALDSLIGQSYTDFELVISDNGSTDATECICREYADEDERIRYYREAVNRGVSWNFNRVFELSRGEYFKWAAADDICAAMFLERTVDSLDNDETIVCCHARRKRRLDASSHRVDRRFVDVLLSSGWSARSAGLIRSEALRQTSLIRPYYGWEKVLMAELSMMGRFRDLPDVLFFQRVHAAASSNLRSAAEQRQFVDPSTAKQRNFPRLRLLQGHFLVIWRYPLSLSTKILCLAGIGRYLLQISKWQNIFLSLGRGTGVSGDRSEEAGS
jgi:glycosyltransferase involved in cell wall biosynthesis